MAQVIIDKLKIGNDNDIWLKGFRDSRAAEGVYLNAATASFTIKTAGGSVFHGPVAMSYDTGSNGDYVGSIDSTEAANLVDGGIYTIEVVAVQGTVNGKWEEQSVAVKRET